MAATPYLPTSEVAKVQNFVQFSSTVSALNTALQSAFASASVVIVVQADTITTGNALIIVNDQIVFSVPPNNWVGLNGGQWSQWTPAQVNGNAASAFTPYFTS